MVSATWPPCLGLCQRNFVNTGVTRGKKLVVLIGQRKALAMAVKNNRTENRFYGLLARLQAAHWSQQISRPTDGTCPEQVRLSFRSWARTNFNPSRSTA
jgi:hypothetical protein